MKKDIKYILGGLLWQKNDFYRADLKINGEIIEEISPELEVKDSEATVINAEGLNIFPGFIDMHVHFREPGFSYKETIATGSLAALAGGFTTVCTMPNLNPAPDSIENLQRQLEIIDKDAAIRVIPYATITRNRTGRELVDYSALAPYVAGFSDDGSGVQDSNIMKAAMEGIRPTGKILAAHCEVNALLNGGYIHEGRYARVHGHKGINSESEWMEVERDIRLAAETGCRLHICHISTKESVSLVREAKKVGLPVTCETAPHYLVFCDDDLREEGKFKMNPPIRSIEDRDALREGLIDGTIDVIATDHAPHSPEEKSRGLQKSAMGVVGLETAFASVYTVMVKSGMIPMERLIDAMSCRAAKILQISGAAGIREGEAANLTLIDLNKNFKVDPVVFYTKGKSTPFEGMELSGKTVLTLYKGRVNTSLNLKN